MIPRKFKPCTACGKDCFPWSKGLCRLCFLTGAPYKPLKKKPLKKVSKKGEQNKITRKELRMKMAEEFLKFYDNHPTKRCIECDKYISKDAFGRINVHHLLPKARYKKYILEHWNFALVCPECHAQCEINILKTPKIKALTQELKEKYG